MDDMGDPVLVQDRVERGSIGDVAADDANVRSIGKLEPVAARPEVEADDVHSLRREHGAGPGADAAERTRDKEALLPHGSTYTVTTSV